jgi:hypothetical protein
MQFTPSFVNPCLFLRRFTTTNSEVLRSKLGFFGATFHHGLQGKVVINVYLLAPRSTSFTILDKEICLEDLVCYGCTSLADTRPIFFDHLILAAIIAPVNIINEFFSFFFLLFILLLSDRFFGRNAIF